MSINIRPMLPQDIKPLMELKNRIGWNQLDADWNFLITAFPKHCFAAVDGEDTIGSATAIVYDNKVAWIGMVMVNEQYRGRGLSTILMNTVIESLRDCRCIKLDATPAGQPVYEKIGFFPEWSITRLINLNYMPNSILSSTATPLLPADLPEVIAFDRQVFGVNRAVLLERLFLEYPLLAFKMTQGNRITGYCLGRDGYKYQQIGPVVASSSGDAVALFSAAARPGRALVVDSIDAHHDFVTFLTANGFAPQRPLLRMYKGINDSPAQVPGYFAIPGGEYG